MKKIVYLFFAIVLSINVKGQSVPCFNNTNTFTFTSFGSSIAATGDFNLDGKIDLVFGTGGGASSNMFVYLGSGTGSFTTSYSVSMQEDLKSIEVADMNNDSYPDILISKGEAGSMSQMGGQVYLNDGQGGFITPNYVHYSCSFTGRIFPININNDAILDFVVTKSCSPTFKAYLNTGTLSTASATNFTGPTNGGTCHDACIGDFDKDGVQDLATTRDIINQIIVFKGDVQNPFATFTTYSMNVGNPPNRIKSADLNNDQYLDLVVTHLNSTGYSVFMGGLNGFSLLNAGSSGTLINAAADFVLDDYDLDGKIDMVVSFAQPINTQLQVFKGNGNGTFSLVSNLASGILPLALESVDVNNDGRKDLISVNQNSNYIKVWLNDTPSLSASSSQSLICPGASVVLTAFGATTYSWSTGATSSSITISPQTTTTYSVIGTNSASGCANTAIYTQNVSICAYQQTINADEIQVSFYPNPTNELLYFTNALGEIVEVNISNMLGQTVYKNTLSKQSDVIDLKHCPKGVYFLNLSKAAGKNEKVYKIIIQ